MRPRGHETTGSGDLFRSRLDQFINLRHELVQLAEKIDWAWIDKEIAPLYSEKGRPGIETRFVIGLLLLKHIYGLSDDEVCERWVYDPYFQHFTGEEFFRHVFPHERSDLSHWRKRLSSKLELLLAESLRVAHEVGALKSKDLARVNVDTTVQPKNVTFPTDAKLLHAAIRGLNRLAKRHALRLRQSYLRVSKRASLMAGRYSHAKQFNRHHHCLRFLRTRLGRLIRDIRRKIDGNEELEEAFASPLSRAEQIRSQRQRQRGWKLYSFHAPEVECIGKGKANAPYEFGVKASIVSTNGQPPGGQFVLHATTLPGNPYDGHTLATVLDAAQQLTGREIERAYVDKGYRGHAAPNPHRVFISGQKRGVFGKTKLELKRRAAIEPLIGHMKAEGHLGRCYLKGHAGDAANALLSAVGHNLRRVLAWLRMLLRLILAALCAAFAAQSALKPAF
jgi:transposase, IS5 family